jgi:hypothetical protein
MGLVRGSWLETGCAGIDLGLGLSMLGEIIDGGEGYHIRRALVI